MKKLISIIIPTHNEEENIPLVCAAVRKVAEKIEKYEFEIIFVDDGSSDRSVEVIKKLENGNCGCKYIIFSRNFGKEAATSAGLRSARGEAAIMIDADLQHPPELIPEFIAKWEDGGEVVVGVRKKTKTFFIKKIMSTMYYRFINRITETTITPHATDFRLMDRLVIDELNRLTERNRMTRALVDWLGFKREYVYFTANGRANGKASYSPLKLFRLAINSMVSMSLLPLKLAGYAGIVIILTSGPLGLFIFIEKYILHDPWNLNFSGPAILAVIILFLVGIILSCLGLMALYIASIHSEVINRPLYVVKNKKL